MRLLFVHERLGALGGAESNAVITAAELARRGHVVGLIHGPGTGKDERAWHEVFGARFALGTDSDEGTRTAIRAFDADLVYVHKMADLKVIGALVNSGRPLVRMVHDHDIYCMKSYYTQCSVVAVSSVWPEPNLERMFVRVRAEHGGVMKNRACVAA
jgi:hypothetical protein